MKKTIISILTLSMINVIGITIDNNTSALTYSDNIGVNFTFSPSLTVSLSSTSGGSSADLVINDLTPGTSSDSNIIDVNVISNNLSGYVLNSTVGNSTHTNPSYDTRNLVHSTSSSTTAVFTSLDYTIAPTFTSPSGFDDNTWGYSYATNYKAGSSTELDWSNYSGLPRYDDAENITTLRTNPGPSSPTGDNTYFKIAAKASPAQASGTYSNVINFTIVGAANPVSFYDAFSSAGKSMYNGYYKMQDMDTSICNSVYTSQLADNTDTMEAQLIDIRDNNIYWVAKLKDGHCWMTQNLDLNLDSSVALTSEDTDLTDHSLTGAYADGYTYDEDTGITTWVPARDTIEAITTENTSINPIPNFENNNDSAYSVDVGSWYWKGATFYPSDNCPSTEENNYLGCNFMLKAPGSSWSNYFATNQSPESNYQHGLLGNYYNWSASIASNASASIVENAQDDPSQTPKNSICPTNWRLPTALNGSETAEGSNSEFGRLNHLYNNGSVSTSQKLESTPLFFTRNGRIWGGSETASLRYAGRTGYYWSSTTSDYPQSYNLAFNSYWTNSAFPLSRGDSGAVRCLANNE